MKRLERFVPYFLKGQIVVGKMLELFGGDGGRTGQLIIADRGFLEKERTKQKR